jgi:hypothetical protein
VSETPTTDGFVGTLEVETRGVSRAWFALTALPAEGDWVKIGRSRAWFTIDLETARRQVELAKLTLVGEAMRSELPVRVAHGGVARFWKEHRDDSFEVNGVRILRADLRF